MTEADMDLQRAFRVTLWRVDHTWEQFEDDPYMHCRFCNIYVQHSSDAGPCQVVLRPGLQELYALRDQLLATTERE